MEVLPFMYCTSNSLFAKRDSQCRADSKMLSAYPNLCSARHGTSLRTDLFHFGSLQCFNATDIFNAATQHASGRLCYNTARLRTSNENFTDRGETTTHHESVVLSRHCHPLLLSARRAKHDPKVAFQRHRLIGSTDDPAKHNEETVKYDSYEVASSLPVSLPQ